MKPYQSVINQANDTDDEDQWNDDDLLFWIYYEIY